MEAFAVDVIADDCLLVVQAANVKNNIDYWGRLEYKEGMEVTCTLKT